MNQFGRKFSVEEASQLWPGVIGESGLASANIKPDPKKSPGTDGGGEGGTSGNWGGGATADTEKEGDKKSTPVKKEKP